LANRQVPRTTNAASPADADSGCAVCVHFQLHVKEEALT
jgi:hypothetical protein